MEKGKKTIIKLLIIITSFFLVDGGRPFLLFGDNLQLLLAQNHSKDIEIPHQHHTINFHDDEKWVETFNLDLSSFNKRSFGFFSPIKFVPQEFLDSIWQPPKSA
jgi:hypothetical protein